jgi:hypothetical protein
MVVLFMGTTGTQPVDSSLLVCPSTSLEGSPTPPTWIDGAPLCHTGTRELSPDPETQAAQVIDLMRQYAIEDAKSAPICDDATQILFTATDPTDARELAAAVWRFVHDRVKFTRDQAIAQPFVDSSRALRWNPVDEALIRPREMSRLCSWNEAQCQRVGDCDDFSMWCADILLCIGVPCSYVTVAGDPEDPKRYSHVYTAAKIESAQGKPGRFVIDASHGRFPGDEVPNRYGKRHEWPIEKRSPFRDFLLPVLAMAGLFVIGWRYAR